MLGYVLAYKPELRMREYEVYRSYYCGVCQSVAKRIGQLPRLALSYDFAFLAVLLASLSSEPEEAELSHCLVHPVKKIPITKNNSAIDYAADMMVLLVYYNMLDDKADEHKIRGTLGAAALYGKARELSGKYPDVAQVIEKSLKQLAALEAEKSPSLDATGDAFADIMSAVFAGSAVAEQVSAGDLRILSHLGRNLGRWIYLADALDDLEDDQKSGSYNPFIYREGGTENAETVLYACLGEISRSFELLDIKKNKGILENIIYAGLERKSLSLLEKRKE